MRPAPLAALHPVTEQCAPHDVFLDGRGQTDEAQTGIVPRQRTQLVLGVHGEHGSWQSTDKRRQAPGSIAEAEERRVEPGPPSDHDDLQAGDVWQQTQLAIQLTIHPGSPAGQRGHPPNAGWTSNAELGTGRDLLQGPALARAKRIVQLEDELANVRRVGPGQPDGAEAAGRRQASMQRLVEARWQDGARSIHLQTHPIRHEPVAIWGKVPSPGTGVPYASTT